MRTIWCTLCLLAMAFGLACMPAAARAADSKPQAAAGENKPFELLDGDRVVFVGGTFFDRESRLGYIETALTSRFPDRNITFRNLGYAGDTVRCESRTVCEGWANFGPPEEGFQKLKKLVEEIKPTVVFVGYGMSESFEGERKLPQFVQDYNKLLDMLAEASGAAGGKPRFVLIGPNYHEDMGRPLPDPTEHNKQIEAYTAAIGRIATERGAPFVPLYAPFKHYSHGPTAKHLTEDGIQLSAVGYLTAAHEIDADLFGLRFYRVDANAGSRRTAGLQNTTAEVVDGKGLLSVKIRPSWLPLPPIQTNTKPPESVHFDDGILYVRGLGPGDYTLAAAGADESRRVRFTVSTSNPQEIQLPLDAVEGRQAEALRQLIVAKNLDYFGYWRHENDTYILGYRKHEQGKNAVELPQFIPLAETKDKEINKLKVPQPVTYTLEKAAK